MVLITRSARVLCLISVTACAPAPSGGLSPQPAETLVSLQAGGSGTCLTTASGAGYCWGAFGEERGTIYRIHAIDGDSARFRSISPSLWRVCGLSLGGDPWCDGGLIGGWTDSSGNSIPLPATCYHRLCLQRLPTRGELPAGVTRMVVSGGHHACAIGSDAAAYCWGRDGGGKLGTGSWAIERASSGGALVSAPVAVSGGLRFARLSASTSVTCGIALQTRFLYCWGHHDKLNPGDRAHPGTPVRVLPEVVKGDRRRSRDIRFTDLTVGKSLACAVSIEGGVYCWGDNYRCALGACRTGDSSRPKLIPIPGRAVQVDVGRRHACARTVDGRLYCWGNNTQGQLGSLVSMNAGPDGLPPDYNVEFAAPGRVSAADDPCFLGGRCSPAAVEVGPGHHWAALAVGPIHACALAADDGGIYCWGGTEPGFLGGDARLVPCINRSPTWKDVQCQPSPRRVPGLPELLAPSVPDVIPAGRGPLSETVVTVSARQMRIAFPVDTVGRWGWPAMRDASSRGSYSWRVYLYGMDGPAAIVLSVTQRDSVARTFSTLEDLVAEGGASVCTRGMAMACGKAPVASMVEGNRVVMVLEDSALIARLFGMRQPEVSVHRRSPDAFRRSPASPITVRYVDPQIPLPDSATRADSARSWRRHEARITSITRSIVGLKPDWPQFWIAAGDSAALWVEEMTCHYDVCSYGQMVSDSGWSIGDTSILKPDPACGETSAAASDKEGIPGPGNSAEDRDKWYMFLNPTSPVRCVIHAQREGRTTLSVHGIYGPSDTAASRSPPATELERTIIVGPPLSGIVLSPKPDTVAINEPVVFHVKALGEDGKAVSGVPLLLITRSGFYSRSQVVTGPVTVRWDEAGEKEVIAWFRDFADTIRVVVTDREQ